MRLVPLYMAAQYLGALVASAVLWAEYHGAIILAEQTILDKSNSSEPATYTKATHGIFASYPFFDTDKVLMSILLFELNLKCLIIGFRVESCF